MNHKRNEMRGRRTILPVMIAILFAVTAFAVISITADDGSDAASGDYNAGDIAVINSIISEHGLGWTPGPADGSDDPGWGNVEWSVDATDKRIVELYLDYYDLTGELDVSGLTYLEYLDCSENNLTSLNLSGCSALTAVRCEGNSITSIDSTGCSALETVHLSRNDLTSIPTLPDYLKSLHISRNNLTSLAGLPSGLEILKCHSNLLTSVSGLPPDLKDLSVWGNPGLKSLNMSGMTELVVLDCGDNSLTSLNVSGCTALTDLYCGYNNLASLNVSDCTALTDLYCEYNDLASLDVSNLTSLDHLECGENKLTSLNISGCVALKEIYCPGNSITSIDATGCDALESLHLSRNNLTSIPALPDHLKNLHISQNDLTSLAGLPSGLKYLKCHSNNLLTSVSGLPAGLEDIDIWNNSGLTSLDVSNLAALVNLNCSENRLTSLNVSGCTALETLNCEMNELTGLDVTGLSKLAYINCEFNFMESISNVVGYASPPGGLYFDPQRTEIIISDSDSVSDIKSKIETAIAGGKVPVVKGSKTNATEKLSIDMSDSTIYWDAAYAGNALELINGFDFILGEGVTMTLTGLETDYIDMAILGTMTVNGGVSAIDTWFWVGSDGTMTVNGDISAIDSLFRVDSGGTMTVNGNITFDGGDSYVRSNGGKISVTGDVTTVDFPGDTAPVIVAHPDGEIVIGGDIVTSGIAIGVSGGNITVNGNIEAGGEAAIVCNDEGPREGIGAEGSVAWGNATIRVKGNVVATGENGDGYGVVIGGSVIVKIDGALTAAGEYIADGYSMTPLTEEDFTSRNAGGYSYLYEYEAWSVYIGLIAGGSESNYYITASATNGASISPSGQTSVAKGSSKTFTFSASSVIVDGRELSAEEVAKGTYTFPYVLSNHTIEVSGVAPEIDEYQLIVNIIGGDGYVEYKVGNGAFVKYVPGATVKGGSAVTLKAFPSEGYSFKEWQSGGKTFSSAEVTFNADGTLTVSLYLEDGDGGGIPLWMIMAAVLVIVFIIAVIFLLLRGKKT